jgi:hypothetical protein
MSESVVKVDEHRGPKALFTLVAAKRTGGEGFAVDASLIAADANAAGRLWVRTGTRTAI